MERSTLIGRALRGHGELWGALLLLIAVSAILAPASLAPTALSAILPFAAFVAIASMGQLLVVMTGGIDLSVPSVITLMGVILLKESRGSDARLTMAVVACLLTAAAIGFLNGFAVSKLKITSLVATLAIGTMVTGATLWYLGGLAAESVVPPGLAQAGADKPFGISFLSYHVLAALALMVTLSLGLSKTTLGRKFVAVGANPRAAWVAGMAVARYQIAAYTIAGLLYGVAGVLLSAFIQSPNLALGAPYLLTTVVAVVISGASLTGGTGSMVATVAGAVFITQLEQMLRVLGASSALQLILRGLVIAVAMALPALRLGGISKSAARFGLPRHTGG